MWLDKVLYVNDLRRAKLACLVPDKLGKIFDQTDIISAFSYCFERSPEDITAYLEENFKLAPRDETKHHIDEQAPKSDDNPAQTEASPKDEKTSELDEKEVNGSTLGIDEEGEKKIDSESDDSKEVGHEDKSHRPHPPKPYKPNIMELFARSLGYRKDSNERFTLHDGSAITKTIDNRFPWEKRSASGDIIRYYWPKEHCLEREPLQLEADVWGLIEKFPDKYSLVLSTPEGKPVEVSGARLLSMRDEGAIVICPATYRLVYDRQ